MKNKIEQIAQQNGISIEFVTWFFNEKKSACGEHWFLALGAMWEGWKGRSVEMDRLAAENVAIKTMNDCLSEELRGYESDGAFEGPMMHLLWWQTEIPATNAAITGIKADGVEEFAKHCDDSIGFVEPEDEEFYTVMEEHASEFAKQLREGADK